MSKITVLQGQTILDMAIQITGDFTGVVSLALLNELCITDELEYGQPLALASVVNAQMKQQISDRNITPATYQCCDDFKVNGMPYAFVATKQLESIVQTIANQSLLDITLQECGSFEDLIQMALLNDKSITDDIQQGEMIKLGYDVVSDSNKKLVMDAAITPATAYPLLIGEAGQPLQKPEGIGYWAIGLDFIVS